MMGCIVKIVLLMSILFGYIDADLSFFAVPKSLYIGVADPNTVRVKWTFSASEPLITNDKSAVGILMDLKGDRRRFIASLTDPFYMALYQPKGEALIIKFNSTLNVRGGTEYLASFRNRLGTGKSTTVQQCALKQKVPGRLEIAWQSTRAQLLKKFVIERCASKCVRRVLRRSDSCHVLSVPIHTDFTLTLTAFYKDRSITRYSEIGEAICDTDPSYKPGAIPRLIRGTHLMDVVDLEWEPARQSRGLVTHYEIHVGYDDYTLSGTRLLVNSTHYKSFMPTWGLYSVLNIRAVYVDSEGRECNGPMSSFEIKRINPPKPQEIRILERKPNSIRYEVIPADPTEVATFKISVIAPSSLKDRYITTVDKVTTFDNLRPNTLVVFEARQCHLRWETDIRDCGDPVSAQVRTRVRRPPPVEVEPELRRDGLGVDFIDWNKTRDDAGPIAGYRVLIRGQDEEGFTRDFHYDVGPEVQTFRYSDRIANPKYYAVMAYVFDPDSGDRVYSTKVWISPEHVERENKIFGVIFAVIALTIISMFIYNKFYPVTSEYDAQRAQENIEMNFARAPGQRRAVDQ